MRNFDKRLCGVFGSRPVSVRLLLNVAGPALRSRNSSRGTRTYPHECPSVDLYPLSFVSRLGSRRQRPPAQVPLNHRLENFYVRSHLYAFGRRALGVLRHQKLLPARHPVGARPRAPSHRRLHGQRPGVGEDRHELPRLRPRAGRDRPHEEPYRGLGPQHHGDRGLFGLHEQDRRLEGPREALRASALGDSLALRALGPHLRRGPVHGALHQFRRGPGAPSHGFGLSASRAARRSPRRGRRGDRFNLLS